MNNPRTFVTGGSRFTVLPHVWSLVLALCGCASEHTAKQSISTDGSAAESVDAEVAIADAALDRHDECGHVFVATSGACEIALPAERWAERLDCMSLILFGETKLRCGPPDGWSVAEGKQLTLLGSACDLVRESPATLLEVFVPCAGRL